MTAPCPTTPHPSRASRPHPLHRLAVAAVLALPLAVALILGAEGFIETMRCNPKLMRAIDYSFAGVFTFFAVQVLRTQGR